MLLGKKRCTLEAKCLAGAGVVYKSTTSGITFSSVLHLFSLLCFCSCVVLPVNCHLSSQKGRRYKRFCSSQTLCVLRACAVTGHKVICSVLCLSGHQPLLLSHLCMWQRSICCFSQGFSRSCLDLLLLCRTAVSQGSYS